MAEDAPDERAVKLANRLTKPVSDTDVISILTQNVSVGQRDADGRPVGERVTAEEFVARQKKAETPAPTGGDEEEEFDVTDETEAGDEEAEAADVDAEEADEGGDEGSETDDDLDGDGYELADYDDEDTLEVKVDGEVREVSLRELKRVYSLQEATEKRLKEATEDRNAAKAEREAVHTEIQTHRAKMLHTIAQLDGVLFAPLVTAPDPALRQKNMQEYLLQKDAFEEDQKRITASRAQLASFLAQEQGNMEKSRQEFRAAQQQLLAEKMPELRDPEKSAKVQKDILDAAVYYGFSPAQVAEVDHHGLFLMARDASRWLNMQKLKKSGLVPTDGEEAKPVKRRRRLRAGTSVPDRKQAAVKGQREQRAAEEQARRSGSVNDVAALLISKARKGEANGRRR